MSGLLKFALIVIWSGLGVGVFNSLFVDDLTIKVFLGWIQFASIVVGVGASLLTFFDKKTGGGNGPF